MHSVNPTKYVKKKEINIMYYLNHFAKFSEKNDKNSDQLNLKKDKSFDPVIDGINILKNLFMDKIQEKQDQHETDRDSHNSSFMPTLEKISVSGPNLSQKKRTSRAKPRITWNDTETLFPPKSSKYSTKRINSNRLYKSLIRDWQEVNKSQDVIENTIEFNKTSCIDYCVSKDPLLSNLTGLKGLKKLKAYKKDLLIPEISIEKVAIEKSKKKDLERQNKLFSKSAIRQTNYGSAKGN
mmetsp:Transcript_17380/g.19491  ORF Transcript_17380/g.19491 Transcript_17380/m.19491 type:complete len:238 (+) Transcript_17380:594-1307(+)